jgi:hypothetical protein
MCGELHSYWTLKHVVHISDTDLSKLRRKYIIFFKIKSCNLHAGTEEYQENTHSR